MEITVPNTVQFQVCLQFDPESMTSTNKKNDKELKGKLPTEASINQVLMSIKEDITFEKQELAIVNFSACGKMIYCIVFQAPIQLLEEGVSFAHKRVKETSVNRT